MSPGILALSTAAALFVSAQGALANESGAFTGMVGGAAVGAAAGGPVGAVVGSVGQAVVGNNMTGHYHHRYVYPPYHHRRQLTAVAGSQRLEPFETISPKRIVIPGALAAAPDPIGMLNAFLEQRAALARQAPAILFFRARRPNNRPAARLEPRPSASATASRRRSNRSWPADAAGRPRSKPHRRRGSRSHWRPASDETRPIPLPE